MDITISQDVLELELNIEDLEEKAAPSGGGETVLPLPAPLALKRH
jgi:hypothetical protein